MGPAMSRDAACHVTWCGLPCHVACAVQVFESMEEVLVSAPMLASTGGLSRSELHRRWAEWKKEVKYRLEAGHYLPILQLHLLAKVSISNLVR